MVDILRGDNKTRQIQAISTVPIGYNTYSSASVSIPSSEYRCFVVTTYPQSDTLSTWNFLWSLNIDTNADGYEWPSGANVSTVSENIDAYCHTSYIQSSDSQNIRVNLITVKNFDLSSAHTVYLYFKAYTQASVQGSNG